MVRYQPRPFRPALGNYGHYNEMGALSSMGGVDWLLLLGGAVVGGAGINGLVRQLGGPSAPNAIAVLVDLVLTGVGLTLFVQKGRIALA